MVTLVGALQGCSSSSNGAASQSEADGSTGAGTISVLVVIPDYGPGVTARIDAPGAGAAVSIDLPGGGQQTAIADANGAVTFSGIDWSKGSASLLGYLKGQAPYGVADVNPSNFASIPNGPHQGKADVVLYLFPTSNVGPVAVTATWQNKAAAADYVVASATTAFGLAGTATATGSFTVASGLAYTLVTHEFSVEKSADPRDLATTDVRWASYPEPAPTGATQALTVDLASGGTTLTPTTTHTHGVIPGGATGLLGKALLFVDVSTAESFNYAAIGGQVARTISADGSSYDTVNEHVAVDGATPVTVYQLYKSASLPSASVVVKGAPQDNATIDNFLTPINVTTTSVSLSQPVDTSSADPTTVTRLSIFDSSGNTLLVVDAPPGLTALHFPTLSGDVKTIVASSQQAYLYSLADMDAATFTYLRTGASRAFAVTP